jgi:hypothetical protein
VSNSSFILVKQGIGTTGDQSVLIKQGICTTRCQSQSAPWVQIFSQQKQTASAVPGMLWSVSGSLSLLSYSRLKQQYITCLCCSVTLCYFLTNLYLNLIIYLFFLFFFPAPGCGNRVGLPLAGLIFVVNLSIQRFHTFQQKAWSRVHLAVHANLRHVTFIFSRHSADIVALR